MLNGEILEVGLLSGNVQNQNIFSAELERDVIKTKIEINEKIDKGFLRYNSNTDTCDSVLPDNELDADSMNIVQNDVVASAINSINTSITALETKINENTESVAILGRTKADLMDVPTDVSQLKNDAGYISEELDPTVPSWAKSPDKPTYQYREILNTPYIPQKFSDLTDDVGLATKQETEATIQNLIGGASEALDTLKEIEDWILNDESGTTALTNRIVELERVKVDKVDGMGLSSNDYTDDDKAKLDGLTNYNDTEVKSQISEIRTSVSNNVDEINKLKLELSDIANDENIVKTTNLLILTCGTSEA